jgi:ectoine hydroxylase-related dioxygenase (phytanoyl-CoA dioxygenase family)
MLILPTANGQAVLFHDDLLHGGSANKADSCRISLEFTVCYPN